MNTDGEEKLLRCRRLKARETENVLRRRRIWVPLAALVVAALARISSADPPLPADEVRDRRLVHEERPLWREALALPNDTLLFLSWPMEQLLCWAERVRLGTRVQDVVLAPIRSQESQEQ